MISEEVRMSRRALCVLKLVGGRIEDQELKPIPALFWYWMRASHLAPGHWRACVHTIEFTDESQFRGILSFTHILLSGMCLQEYYGSVFNDKFRNILLWAFYDG
jgi:hypothetical protein